MSASLRKRPSCCRAAKCREWDGPAALPPPTARRVRGGLSGVGAPPCLADPPFAQRPPSELIWARTHFTWSASIRAAPLCCERRSHADALHRGLRTCHPVSLVHHYFYFRVEYICFIVLGELPDPIKSFSTKMDCQPCYLSNYYFTCHLEIIRL